VICLMIPAISERMSDSALSLPRLAFSESVSMSKDHRSLTSFDIETDSENARRGSDKAESDIRSEIAGIIKQITASVTYLPLIETPCKFDILVYTRKEAQTPQAWEESAPRLIANPEQVKLRSFSTKIHKIEPTVAYHVDQ